MAENMAEKTVTEEVTEPAPQNDGGKKKKNLKWLWVSIAILVVAGLTVWCCLAEGSKPDSVIKLGTSLVFFTVAFIVLAVGYLFGAITIKGVSLGTAGVFLLAILFGWLITTIPKDWAILGKFSPESSEGAKMVSWLGGPIMNIGLALFVGSVGFIAGPNFFKNLKKNFKTYILLGAVIILVGTAVAVICTLITDYGPEFWSGVLSGALTSTPGFSAAQEAAKAKEVSDSIYALITVGHAIAYPFGVVGVVLFVQLVPKFLKADMEKERSFISIATVEHEAEKSGKKLFEIEPFGFAAFGIAVICGALLGSITIPLTGKGFAGPCFSLGSTGGILIMCLVFGHFGKIGKISMKIPASTLKVLKELGLALFLLGAGVEGGVELVTAISEQGGAIVAWGFVGGALMTLLPMVVGFIMAKYLLKLPLLNNLGSITGGMTSTPALGTLISVSKTDDVASAYASTYPIALILVVLSSQLIITLL